jgi:hypothetical protein
MLVEAVLRDEPQLRLNAMKQPVKHHLLAYIGSLLREHVQGEAEPPQPAPGDGAVHETPKRSGSPAGSGWLVARVRVRWSTITIGPQSDTPHKRPASRSQSFVTSSK